MRFGELVDKSEEEKRALIYDPEFWKRVDMDRVAPNWAIFRYLAEVQPENFQDARKRVCSAAVHSQYDKTVFHGSVGWYGAFCFVVIRGYPKG